MKQIKPDKYKSYLQHNLIELEYLKFEKFENIKVICNYKLRIFRFH